MHGSRGPSTQSEAEKIELDRIRRDFKNLTERSKKKTRIHWLKVNIRKEYFSIGALAIGNGNHTNDENGMTAILNNCLAAVFTDEGCCSPQPPEIRRTEEILTGVIIVESDILRRAEKIKVRKAPGRTKHDIRDPRSVFLNNL